MSRSVKTAALRALAAGFSRSNPGVALTPGGYVGDYRDNLLRGIEDGDFKADLNAGSGNELTSKFLAVHSSSALGVNVFGPFRRHMADLQLLGSTGFTDIRFERKCPTGLLRRTPPNLDVVLTSQDRVIGIESKLTEHLGRQRAKFSPEYDREIQDERRTDGYFREMLRLLEAPDSYAWLNAAQLIKHAFGLAHTFKDRPVTLLYLFWEPRNPGDAALFAAHRDEVAAFADRVSGSPVRFQAMSYPELWAQWRETGPAWLQDHLDRLETRYLVQV